MFAPVSTALPLSDDPGSTMPIQSRERRSQDLLKRVRLLFEDGCREVLGGRQDGVSLAAVGSLARGEAGPCSDVDLVLLHDDRSIEAGRVHELADRIWYPLWDAGLDLDHAVRTPRQSREVAAKDLSAAVGLLDIVAVGGDQVLAAAVHQAVAHDWRANARTRLPELVELTAQRHARHADLTSALEPDLKEGRGGLRDMTVLRALTAAWLADRPHGTVDAAYSTLLDVRDAVHEVTGRGRARLHRQDQDAVAERLGYQDADALLTELAGAARTVAFAFDSTARRAGQARRARLLRIGPRRPALRPLGHGIYEHDGEVVLGERSGPANMLLLLRTATAAARRELPLAPTTQRNLTADLPPLEQAWPASIREAFVDLLGAGRGLVQIWEALDQAGVVAHLLPEWKAVANRPQRSAVHRHTVDRHLIETVVEAAQRRHAVGRPDLLLVAALLHDIGKVEGASDHAAEGAPVAATIARRMGFAEVDVAIIERLVAHHLTLVELATHRDPADPGTVRQVCDVVDQGPDLLDLLRQLAESDAVAAGPKAWTRWRAGLVEDLTCRSRLALQRQHEPVGEPPTRAFLLSPAATAALLMGEAHVRVNAHDGGARIDIVQVDRLGLFADTAGLLAARGLVVRAARVRTTERAAVHEWHVESPRGELPTPQALTQALRRLADGDQSPVAALNRAWDHADPGTSHAAAQVSTIDGSDATIVEVRAADRLGLLRDLGVTLARFGASVRSAHVATHADQTSDTFYLTTARGRPLAAAQAARLCAALVEACRAPGATDVGREGQDS